MFCHVWDNVHEEHVESK